MSKTTGSMTPYEIRLEILQMAKDHLDATFKAQCDFASQMMNALVSANLVTMNDLSKLVPMPYQIEDITKKASELYSFILKKE